MIKYERKRMRERERPWGREWENRPERGRREKERGHRYWERQQRKSIEKEREHRERERAHREREREREEKEIGGKEGVFWAQRGEETLTKRDL